MKNKQRALVLAVLFITAIFIVNSYAYPGTARTNRIVGFAGVPTTEFSGAKELGAATVQVNTLSASELQSALETAKSLGLGLVGRAESRRQFQTETYNIDFVKLKNATTEVFSETEIASDPNFLGYYIIDEPCHADKWNITPADFRQFYDTVKEVDPNINILVNFGYLGCLEDFIIEGNGKKIGDIATFVITPKKLRLSPDHIANEAATAKMLKEACPDLQIIPLIAVYEYPARDENLPSADWVRQTGLKVLEYDLFDGLVYFPWHPSTYMGDTIENIADDPDYISAFSDVFDVALEKYNETANCPDDYVSGPGDYDFSILHDGLTRLYKVHVPPGYDINRSSPVIIAFHGGGGNAENCVDSFRLNEKSDIEGFIVVYPEGTGPLVKGEVFGTWNAGRCCPPAMDNNVDDVGFIELMLEELENDFNIDKTRIYATGMSNGAQMCYRLACELADKIAAIAPCGSIGTFDNCTPSRPVPVMHFHGLEDPCGFYGGGQCGTCMAEFLNALGIPVTPRPWDCIPVPAYVDKWRKQNGCSNQTKITFQTGNATCTTYQECQNNAEVTICTIAGMGHTWPGSTEYNAEACKTRPNGYVCRLWQEAVGALSNDIIASDAMWEFFKRHTLNDGNGVCEPGEPEETCPEDCKEFANVYLATRIPVKTDAQIQSV